MVNYIIGVDLGQTSDFTAICVMERSPSFRETAYARPRILASYQIRHLERLPLGTPYPQVVARVHAIWNCDPIKQEGTVVADATGCGAAVIDLLRAAMGWKVHAVTITGGTEAKCVGPDWCIPKRDLVSVTKVLLQTERIKIAKSLPVAKILVDELLNFQAKITLAGNDTYGAWREGVHDDLVLATAMAAYYGENKPVGLADILAQPRHNVA